MLENDVSAMEVAAAGARARMKRIRARLIGMTRLQSDARALFLDADGHVRPEAARLFSHLSAQADIVNIRGGATDAELREALGAQRMVRLILSSLLLDRDKIEHLQTLLNAQKGQS